MERPGRSGWMSFGAPTSSRVDGAGRGVESASVLASLSTVPGGAGVPWVKNNHGYLTRR
jgi:hypothetical protein